ncbi:ABC transporter ATP-binding protein [Luteolibacter marinus]|uniref:ABC transporter ATP-binding protein n=1 Tax=Luteolibacter marinus TaxID=2776705 RepID=UPI0018667141|nr:ABC transporter ATP-binding protein [Luteolibacter marinus]
MRSFLHSSVELVRRVFFLARPYGRRKLGFVFALSLAQGVFQVLGVTSIFPFLALAADPGKIRKSKIGEWILNHFPPMSDGQLLIAAGLLAIGMLLLSNVINLASDVGRARYARSFGHWLRLGLLKKIAGRPYGDFLTQNSGVLLKKVSQDVTQYITSVLLPLLDGFARALTVLFLLLTLLAINPSIAIGAAIVFGSFYGLVFRLLGKRRREMTRGMKAANRGIMREAQQLLGGIKPVKVHRAEDHFLDRFRTHSRKQAKLMAWMPIYQNGPRYFIEPLAFGGVVFIAIISAARGENLVALLPTLGVMALAGYRLLPAIQLLYAQLTLLSTARHSLDEVFDEFIEIERATEKEPKGKHGRFSCPPPMQWNREVSIENLTFQYPGSSRRIIDNLSLRIPKNSVVGITGQTGSGKSTFVDLVLGLLVPTGGVIKVDQTPLSKEIQRAWRGGIGYVPQDIFLIDDSIAANIAFGIPKEEIDPERLREAAAAAQILVLIDNELEKGWDTVVGERGIRLSGGQRQRVGLARALYHRPSLLILDEATSALDTETEAEVMKAIESLHGTVTMLIIAHRLSTIEKCDFRIELQAKSTDIVVNSFIDR